MRIAILSRGPQLYSTQSIVNAAIDRGHTVFIIDHVQCNLYLDNISQSVSYENERLDNLDAIIPRIGASVTRQGAWLIQQFESKKIYCLTGSGPLLQTRDKLRCLQQLAGAGIPLPPTAMVKNLESIPEMVRKLNGPPIVIKLLESTHGVGVMLLESMKTIQSVAETMQKLSMPVLLQQFISESSGTDIRAFVVGDEIVASMKRVAAQGEFRSNLHRGASSVPIALTGEEALIVKKVVRILHLQVAGVDLLRTNSGPMVLEVNPSPGLEGIENTTGVDISGKIIRHLEKKVKKHKSVQYYEGRKKYFRK